MSNLPANISNMATGLAASIQTVGVAGDEQFMKMSKSGVFVYGAENIEVEEDSIWAINPAGFQHGWVAWGDKQHGTEGKNLGEKMGPAAAPIFPEADLPPVEGEWSQAVGIQLKCLDGEDEGTQCFFKSNSYGGKKAYATILGEVVKRIQAGESDIVPAVKLDSTSYKHDKYGTIHNPVFTVTGWLPMAGPEAEGAEKEEKPAANAEPKTKAAKIEAPEQEDAGEEDAPAPRRRRRRKAA